MKNTDFNELAKRAYENAKKKGFHDGKRAYEHYLMLVVCELAEAVEADREGRRADRRTYNFLLQEYGEPLANHLFDMHIKDTVEDELADAVIRLLDFMGMLGTEIPEGFISTEHIKADVYDEEGFREQMKELGLAENLFTTGVYSIINDSALQTMYSIFVIAEIYDIDLLWHIKEKMEYNEKREYRHGKEY